MPNNIFKFLDFIYEVRGSEELTRPIRKITNFTKKDMEDISDCFLEYVDDYRMQEIYNDNVKFRKSSVYFEIGLAANAYVEIHIPEGKNSEKLFSEIKKRMENEFIPLLHKKGFKLFNDKINVDTSYVDILENLTEYCRNISMVFYK